MDRLTVTDLQCETNWTAICFSGLTGNFQGGIYRKGLTGQVLTEQSLAQQLHTEQVVTWLVV